MLILEISYLHALCYNIYVIFIVVIIRPLGPRFIVSHRAFGFAGTALLRLMCLTGAVRKVSPLAQHRLEVSFKQGGACGIVDRLMIEQCRANDAAGSA